MRINMENFLALTVALGTAGAIGVAVYTNQDSRDEATEEATEPEAEPEPFPEAEPLPPPTPEPAAAAAPAPAASPGASDLDDAEESLDDIPGPQVESFNF